MRRRHIWDSDHDPHCEALLESKRFGTAQSPGNSFEELELYYNPYRLLWMNLSVTCWNYFAYRKVSDKRRNTWKNYR